MKKTMLLVLGLCLSSLLFSANTFFQPQQARYEYVSTTSVAFSLPRTSSVITGNGLYRVVGDYYTLVGVAAVSTHDSIMQVGIGSGSSTATGSYSAKYDVVIPMGNPYPIATTNNFHLDLQDEWWSQGIVSGVDTRGLTTNVILRTDSTTTANNISGFYLKFRRDTISQ